jgi:hypothetical protein
MNTTVNSEPGAEPGVEYARFDAEAQVPNFDRIAKLYRWMELFTFGPYLAQCRAAFLPELGQARRALILGDGDGRFTARLFRTNPYVQIEAVDASSAMLDALLRRSRRHTSRICACCADARDWQPAKPPYDLVVTHFFLDCLRTEECRELAARLRDEVSPHAVWIVSEFAIPKSWFGQWVARPLVWLLYWAFGLLTGLQLRSLPDYQAALRAASFTLAERRTWLCGLLTSEMWGSKT